MIVMIGAMTLMCALSSQACATGDAQTIASAIDAATDDERLRAVMVTYSWHESHFAQRPEPVAWDAGWRSCGAFQMPCSYVRRSTLEQQARTWLSWVAQSSIGSVDSSPRRAAHRLREAERLLGAARP